MSGTRVADLAEVPAQGAGALLVEIDDVEVGIYRVGDEIVAWRNVCPHGAAPVCRGEVDGTRVTSLVYEYTYGRDQEILQCPWHGWEFDLLDGEHLAVGSDAKLRRVPVRVDGDGVFHDPARRSIALTVTVSERSLVTPDVVVLALKPADGGDVPAWTAGTHIEVALPSGLVRHYSLCGDPRDRSTFRIAVLREAAGRGGSSELHEIAEIGTVLEITAVRNRFALPLAPHTMLVAGGIGVTPITSMVSTLVKRRGSFSLVYTGRERDRMAFADALGELPECTLIESGRTGRPDLRALVADAPDGTVVLGCGPQGMIDELRAIGEAEAGRVTVITESFEGSTPGARAEGSAAASTAFDVHLARRGGIVRIQADQSILDGLRDAGVTVPSSCEQGWCGTCETPVVDGVPDHRDDVLTEAERDSCESMMVCVSRSLSDRITLEL